MPTAKGFLDTFRIYFEPGSGYRTSIYGGYILYYDDVDYKIYNDEYDKLIAKYINLSIDELYE